MVDNKELRHNKFRTAEPKLRGLPSKAPTGWSQIGCSGRTKLRTNFDLFLIIGIAPLRGENDIVVAYPFRYPVTYISEMDKEPVVQEAAENPIHLALRWAHEMKTDPGLLMSQVAEREELSRARITQNMSLLKLNKDIRDYLSNLTCGKKTRFFSERRLRPLTRLHQSEQSRIFNEMVEVSDKKLGGCGAE